VGLKPRPALSAEQSAAAPTRAPQQSASQPANQPVNPKEGRVRRSPALQKLVEIGREVLGIQDLRPGQGEALEHILAGNNLLAVMPTGSGKSLLYQLPSLVLPGITVVVSPLLALIKDQVDKMKQRGVTVVRIDSSLTVRQERAMKALAAAPGGKLLLTTPERMAQPEFRELLKSAAGNVGVSLFVVDEAHCVSHWGHDFRPSYLDMRKALEDLGEPQVLATTATAPPHVREDILHQLGMPDAELVTTTFDRPNLHYECIALPGDDEKQNTLIALLKRLPRPGIVYCATVRAVNALHEMALRHGISAVKYHGRLTKKERDASQSAFMEADSSLIMFATNAFGLGVDKPDVRYVLHYHVPGSLEAYAQEAGRAGRDGKPSRCVLLFSPDDVAIQEYFLKGTYPTRRQVRSVVNALEVWDDGRDSDDEDAAQPTLKNVALASKVGVPRARTVLSLLKDEEFVTESEEGLWALSDPPPDPARLQQKAKQYEARRIADRRRLDALLDYVRGVGCRNRMILEYLGEPDAPDCGRCDNCLRSAEAAEAAAREATMLEETVTDRIRADDGDLEAGEKPKRVIRHRIVSLDDPKPEAKAEDDKSKAKAVEAAEAKASKANGSAAKSATKGKKVAAPEPVAVADNEEIQRLIAEQQEAHAAQQAGLIGEDQWEYVDDDEEEEDENYEYETVVEEYEVIDKTAAALAEEDYVDPENAEITILKRKHVPKPKGKKKKAAPAPEPVKKKRRRRRRRRKVALPKGTEFSSPVLTADKPEKSSGPKTEVRRSRRGAKADAGGPLLVEYVRGSMRINSAPVASATPNDSPPGRKKKRRKAPSAGPGKKRAGAARPSAPRPAPAAAHPAAPANGSETAAASGAAANGEPGKKKRRRRRRRKKGQNGATAEAEGPITFFSTGSSPTPTGVQPAGTGKKKRRRRRRRGRKPGAADQSSPGGAGNE